MTANEPSNMLRGTGASTFPEILTAEESYGTLAHLQQSEKVVLLNVFAIVVSQVAWDNIDRAWAKTVVGQVCGYLGLDDLTFNAVKPLLEVDAKEVNISAEAFLSAMSTDRESACFANFVSGTLNIIIQSEEGYDSRMRQALILFCNETSVSFSIFLDKEARVSAALETVASANSHAVNNKTAEGRTSSSKLWKSAAIASGAVFGSAALIFTGGLAAPAVAAGFTALGNVAVVGGTTAAIGGFLVSSGGTLALTTLFGVSGAGLGGYKMKKRLGDLKSFEFRAPSLYPDGNSESEESSDGGGMESISSRHSSLTLTVLINGWAYPEESSDEGEANGVENGSTSKHDETSTKSFLGDGDVALSSQKEREKHFRAYTGPSNDSFILDFELDDLSELQDSVKGFLTKELLTYAGTAVLQKTVLASLMTSLALPSYIIKAADMVDNPYSIASSKARQAGGLLANILLEREAGNRPVKLIGFSLGAIALFECLRHLVEAGEKGRGIVQEAIFLGAPIPNTESTWALCRTVVPGRIVNCFSPKDFLLKLLSRGTFQAHYPAGMSRTTPEQERKFRIENLDVDEFIKGSHSKYAIVWSDILSNLVGSDEDMKC